MTKYVYLFCHRCNVSCSLTTTAYSSLKRAVKEYERMRDYMIGKPVNCVSEETKTLPVHLRSTDEIPVCHCYVGPKGGNTAYNSYYVVKKVLN